MPSDPRRKIILVVRPAEGGIRSHIISLLEHLDRSRFDITLAAPAKLIESLSNNLPHFGHFDLPLTAQPGPLDVVAAMKLARAARDGGALLHAQGIRAGLVASLATRAASFPLVVTYHNVPGPGRLNDAALAFIGQRATASIAVSKAIARRIGGGDNGIQVIPNGIDLMDRIALNRHAARSALRLADDAIVVACVARLSPEKGVDLLLRAARLLPEALVLIAGDGPERGKLEMSAPPNVRLLGYVPDVGAVFGAADIAAIPSRTEGQGIVALEAMAAGAAVVAFDVGGLGEMIEDGLTGLLAKPGDPVDLASKIAHLGGDIALREQIAKRAAEWVAKHGDTLERIRQIERVYESAAAMTSKKV